MERKQERDEGDNLEPSFWFKDPMVLPHPLLKDNVTRRETLFQPVHSPVHRPQNEPKSDKKEGRKMLQIQIKPELMFERFKTKKGARYQTKNISRHLLNSIWKQLKILAMTNQLNEADQRAVITFGKKGCRHTDLGQLWQRQHVRQKISEWLSSGFFIKSLLTSSVEVKSKLALVKYLQKIRKVMMTGDLSGWKDKVRF